MESKVHEILSFWFGPLEQEPAQDVKKSWWTKNPDFDREIRERFGETLAQAARGEHRDWEATAYGRLALILLFDQFSRNIFRGHPDTYAQDDTALDLARRTVAEGMDQQLRPIERVFVYMPFEHAEDLAMQKQCLQLFSRLIEQVPPEQKDMMKGYYDYAVRHHDIIERFGRFPHRNEILGRESSPEEVEFLKQPGSSF